MLRKERSDFMTVASAPSSGSNLGMDNDFLQLVFRFARTRCSECRVRAFLSF